MIGVMTLKTAFESQRRPITFFLNYCIFNFFRIFEEKVKYFFFVRSKTLTSHLMIITFHFANLVTQTVTLHLNNGYIYNLHNFHNFFRTHFKNGLKLQYCYIG